MKKILACLLCLLLCASLACCGTKNETETTSSEAESNASADENKLLTADEAMARIRSLWKSIVTDREETITGISAMDLMPYSSRIYTPLEEAGKIEAFLELCGTPALTDLTYDGDECMHKNRGILFTFRSAKETNTGETLGLAIVDNESFLVLKLGDATYTAKVTNDEAFAPRMLKFVNESWF